MINLLTEFHKEELNSLYRKRLIAVALVVATLLIAWAVLLIAPAYLLLEIKTASLKERAQTASSGSFEMEGGAILAGVEKKINMVRTESARVKPTGYIDAVTSSSVPGVSIENISYQHKGSTAHINITGTSATRGALLSFVAALENEELFERVFSPTSNLVRDRNAPFVIEIAITL